MKYQYGAMTDPMHEIDVCQWCFDRCPEAFPAEMVKVENVRKVDLVDPGKLHCKLCDSLSAQPGTDKTGLIVRAES